MVGVEEGRELTHHLVKSRGRDDGEQNITLRTDVFWIASGLDLYIKLFPVGCMALIDLLHHFRISGIYDYRVFFGQKVSNGGSERAYAYDAYRFICIIFPRHMHPVYCGKNKAD